MSCGSYKRIFIGNLERSRTMILIEKTEVMGLDHAIRGMRNPMNSWDKSDSGICKGGDNGIGCINCAYTYISDGCKHTYDHSFQVGKNDYDLMMKLVKGGPVHAKFRRMIAVYVDITAPLYWWKEFDTYKVGTVANSCSTMHKIHAKEFTIDDFSHDHLTIQSEAVLLHVIKHLNMHRMVFLTTNTDVNLNYTALSDEACVRMKKDIWWQMIQLLPSSYNQKRTVMLNYEVLAGIYPMRKNHKLDEWREFCQWIEELPWSEIITKNKR
ncbi:MAG: hypothetical protein WDA37_00170 [Dysgonamonadaceae bacterium]